MYITVANIDRTGPYWLSRRLGVDIFPVEQNSSGDFIITYPENEDDYWEIAKNPQSSFAHILPQAEKFSLLASLRLLESKEIIPCKFVVEIIEK